MSAPELAHELNSLLDGSMRYLALAESALDDDATDDVRRRLARARGGLDDMAIVLARAMRDQATGAQLLRQERTVGCVAREIVDSLRSVAADDGVEMLLHVDAAAEELPAGPLGALLSNGMRNAVQACVRGSSGIRRVEVSVTSDDADDALAILINDTGPGLPRPGEPPAPGGHGIGLGVCREIVDELGGRLAFENVPFGRGAVMDIRVPTRSLRDP
ncbi:MAG: HAMP domain-containing histidine kinase [Planctomycetes bacterium]|nr:HAMP domain-containing histidine kinase [Planctomycetota bacterium]